MSIRQHVAAVAHWFAGYTPDTVSVDAFGMFTGHLSATCSCKHRSGFDCWMSRQGLASRRASNFTSCSGRQSAVSTCDRWRWRI